MVMYRDRVFNQLSRSIHPAISYKVIDHEQRFTNEGCNKSEVDRDGRTGTVERLAQGKAGGMRVEGSTESTLQRCDPRKGPGACHSGGPGCRSHSKRQSTCTR